MYCVPAKRVTSPDLESMISLLLQRLGAKSRNAYARYEHGASVPTIEKLDELLRAVSPDRDFVLRSSPRRPLVPNPTEGCRMPCTSPIEWRFEAAGPRAGRTST